MILDRNAPKRFLHPLCLNSSKQWIRDLLRYGGVDRSHIPQAATISVLSLITSPFRIAERAFIDPYRASAADR